MRKSWGAPLLCGTLALTGCYGSFKTAKRLHAWNGEFESKWAAEGAFLLLMLPGYAGAAMADALFFNSVEFWKKGRSSGSDVVRRLSRDGIENVLSYSPSRRRLRVDSYEGGSLRGTLVLEPGPGGGMVATDGRGGIVLSARLDGEVVRLADASGRPAGEIHVGDLARRLQPRD